MYGNPNLERDRDILFGECARTRLRLESGDPQALDTIVDVDGDPGSNQDSVV